MPHPILEGLRRPHVLAHRGLVTPEAAQRGVAENSLAALEAAARLGGVIVESDCHLTRDGEVVLFHDADLLRVTGDPRRIADVTAAELAEIMADRGGLATLDVALRELPEARFNLDIKARAAAEPAGRIVSPHAHRVLLTSFADGNRRRALRAARAERARTTDTGAGPEAPATSPGRGSLIRILLAVATRSAWATARAMSGFDALQIPERYGRVPVLSRRLIEAAHRSGVVVHVWTVNDPARMRQLVELGVDGIVTDRADVAVDLLHRP